MGSNPTGPACPKLLDSLMLRIPTKLGEDEVEKVVVETCEDTELVVVEGEWDYQNPRPMKPEWADKIRKICERDNVSLFFKQIGGKPKSYMACNASGCAKLNERMHRRHEVKLARVCYTKRFKHLGRKSLASLYRKRNEYLG